MPIQEYLKFTQKYITLYGPKVVVLYLEGEWYQVFGLLEEDGTHSGSCLDDIHCYLNAEISTPKEESGQTYQGKPVVISGVKIPYVSNTIRNLVAVGYTVPRIEQIKCPETGVVLRRELGQIYTPGTYIDHNSVSLSNFIGCYWFYYEPKDEFSDCEKLFIGMSMLDVHTGKSNIYETNIIINKQKNLFDDIIGQHIKYQPKEVCVVYSLPDSMIKQLHQHVFNDETHLHMISLDNSTNSNEFVNNAKKCMKKEYQTLFIQEFYQEENTQSLRYLFENYLYGAYSFCYLLNHVHSCNPHLSDLLQVPSIETNNNRMYTGNHSLSQLNIIGGNKENRASSLCRFLNRCRSPIGQREFHRTILSPIVNKQELQSRYDIIEYIQENWSELNGISNRLTCIRDIERLNRYLIHETITPSQFIGIFNTCISTLEIHKILFNHPIILTYLSSDNLIQACSVCKKEIESVLNVDICSDMKKIDYSASFIKSGVCPDLEHYIEIVSDNQLILNAIKDKLNNILLTNRSSRRSPALIKIDDVKKKPKSLLITDSSKLILQTYIENKSSDVLTYQSTYSGETKEFTLDYSSISINRSTRRGQNNIISDELIELCEDLHQGGKEISTIQRQFYMDYVKRVKTILPNYNLIIANFIGKLDVIMTNAFVATKYHYCKPVIDAETSRSYFDAKNLRHPLIEHINTNEVYVPNDVSLGKSPQGILLYGTNAVGKTSLIRAIGIAVTMAQCGMYVPSSSFIFVPYLDMYTRILGNDNLFKGLSTFDVEMSELLKILHSGSISTLVLGDEVCSGTETISATAIIISSIEWIYKKSMSFMFATHFHELSKMTELTNLNKDIHLKHMSVYHDEISGSLVYGRKLEDGPGKCLYGLEVCKSLHFPNEIISRAYDIRNKYNPNMSEHSILESSTSRYNKNVIKRICECCKIRPAIEIDHISPQCGAAEDGYIDAFHKNHSGNLQALCKQCHNEKTAANSTELFKRVKTIGESNPYIITEIHHENQILSLPN